MSHPHIRLSRGGQSYPTDEFLSFIKNLEQNVNGEIYTVIPFDLRIMVDTNHIHIISENATIDIKNTQECREQLIDAMTEYIQYLDFLE